MNWDGSGQTRLTSDANDDSAPVWSPDGTKIAFQSARNSVNYQLYVMNADGSGQVNVSNNSSNDKQPSWSPDSTKIAFTSDRDHPDTPSVYVMNANGSNQTRLTFTDNLFRDEQPVWSPDGMKLAFTSTRDSVVDTWQETDDDGGILTRTAVRSNKEVYVMNADGSAALRLTNTLENDDSASWSGDGTKIVFRSERERECCDPTQQIWVMNSDGSSQANLSNSGYGDHCPSWQHVASNLPPAVNLTSPTNGSTFIAPANITITASASDSDGSISRVDFYQGVTLIGTDTNAPYSLDWNNVAAGSYSLTAIATDNGGATSTSGSITITVNPNAAPAVGITSPANGASFAAPASITITANANDSDGSISRVDFYQGSTLIGASTANPYTISWNNVAAGTYSLTARATDNLGATTTSTAVSITVNATPTVSITSPANGASFTAPANITISANASDSDGSINRVDFYQGTTLIGTDATTPYTITWNNVGAGGYALTAKAIDNLEAITNSNPVNITVGSPPSVSITSPVSGATFTEPANITITADASASGGINRVEFYQGTTLIGTATTSPYATTWNNASAGSHALTARAVDNLGTSTDSTPVNISVNAPPSTSVTSPTTGASFSGPANIAVTANANDGDGSISRVDFYQGTALIGTAMTTPYAITWNDVAAGSYSLTAKATDNLGAQTNSSPVSITVTTPPTVADIRWIVTDQLGTPRMIFDQTGSLSGVSRHDYLPFGEELVGVGDRTTALGYTSNDGARQKFTSKERDIETGLDYFGARYYASMQGRFTSADPLLSSGRPSEPASWNKYSYTVNNPLRFIDPSGLYEYEAGATNKQKKRFEAQLKAAKEALDKIGKKYGVNSDEYKNAKRSLDAYGAPNKANGVIVAFGTTKSGKPAETSGGTDLGGKVKVTIDIDNINDDGNLATVIGHEGSHAQDRADFRNAFTAAYASDPNDAKGSLSALVNGATTCNTSETTAYGVSSVLAEFLLKNETAPAGGIGTFVMSNKTYVQQDISLAGTKVWDPAWAKVDVTTVRANRSAAIATGLKNDPYYSANCGNRKIIE